MSEARKLHPRAKYLAAQIRTYGQLQRAAATAESKSAQAKHQTEARNAMSKLNRKLHVLCVQAAKGVSDAT